MNQISNKKIYFAPIKGITDTTFRNIFAMNFSGLDSAISPFITRHDSVKKINELSPELNRNLKTIPQILTSSPDEFIQLSMKLTDLGCTDLNWNIGCPHAMVLKRSEGAAMLQNADGIDSFLEKIFKQKLPQISIKMRLGNHNSDEILSVIPVLNKYQIHEVTIHARTAEQMYNGKVNLEIFSEALKISNHKIIYNGDITTLEDINILSDKFPEVYGFMVGRGILYNPFLAEEIKSGVVIPDEIKVRRLIKYHKELLNAYKDRLESYSHILDKMQSFWYYLSQSFENGKKINKRLKKTYSIDHYEKEVNHFFSETPSFIKKSSWLFD